MSYALGAVRRASIACGSLSLSYLEGSTTSDKHLLFVHGWGGAAQYLSDTLSVMSDTYRCTAPDMPGFGETAPFPHEQARIANEFGEKPYSHRGLARVLAKLMDALGADSFDVIGHSYGCGVAVALAAMFPQRVGRVVISNFSTFRDERERKMIVMMHKMTGLMTKVRTMKFAQSDGFAKFLGARYFHRLPSDFGVLRRGLDDFLRMDQLAADLTVEDSLGWETPHDMAQLTQPLLLIHCRNDEIMPPRNAEYTAKLAPRGELAWIDNCGHMPMIEKPDEWRALVRAFLSRS